MSNIVAGTSCRTIWNSDGSTEHQWSNDTESWSTKQSAPSFSESDSLPFYDIPVDANNENTWVIWAKARNKKVQEVLNARLGKGKKKKEGKHTPPTEQKE